MLAEKNEQLLRFTLQQSVEAPLLLKPARLPECPKPGKLSKLLQQHINGTYGVMITGHLEVDTTYVQVCCMHVCVQRDACLCIVPWFASPLTKAHPTYCCFAGSLNRTIHTQYVCSFMNTCCPLLNSLAGTAALHLQQLHLFRRRCSAQEHAG
jgi:hypothetical protein